MDDGAADTVERLLAAADAISSLPPYSAGYAPPQSRIAQNYAVKVAQSHIDMAKLTSLQLPYAVPCATRVWLVVKYVSVERLQPNCQLHAVLCTRIVATATAALALPERG